MKARQSSREQVEDLKFNGSGKMYIQLFLMWSAVGLVGGLVFNNVIPGLLVGSVIGGLGCLMTRGALRGAYTEERHREVVMGAGALWGGTATVFIVIGIVALTIKMIV